MSAARRVGGQPAAHGSVNAIASYAASSMEYEGTDMDESGFLFGAGFSVYLK